MYDMQVHLHVIHCILYSRQFILLRFNKRSHLDLYKLSPKGFDAFKSKVNYQISSLCASCAYSY